MPCWYLTMPWGPGPPAPPLPVPVTLLCAVLTDDAVLLSADCRSTTYESDPRFPSGFPTRVNDGEKFQATGVPTVFWGYAGMGAIAKHLMDWASKGTWSSWSSLSDDAEKQSAKAVRRVKEQVRARQVDPDSGFLQFGILFAGYLGGVPNVLGIGQDGIPQLGDGTERNVPLPFGGGVTTAIASWNVLCALHPESTITTPQELADFTNAVCDSVMPLDAPADVWKVTNDGYEKCPVTYKKAGRQS